MKKFLILISIILTSSHFFGQEIIDVENQKENDNLFNAFTSQIGNNINLNNENKIEQRSMLFDFNCNEQFWTVNSIGEIQEWSLINGVILGGDIILSNAGTQSGIAVCGDIDNPTFFGSDIPNQIITYYDDTENEWMNISVTDDVANNGGFGNDQYYMGHVFDSDTGFEVNRILYYFDGVSLVTLVTFESDYINVADIAVDGQGRAWIFRGESLFTTNSLDVYNSTGLLMSFDITFDSMGNYGSFFINDTLYIGMSDLSLNPNSITPIIINGENAELGLPIPFMYDNYSDFASCQNASPLSINDQGIVNHEFVLVPNPTNNIVKLSEQIDVDYIEIINLNGQLLQTIRQNGIIDLTEFPNGMYFLKIVTKNIIVTKKILKK